MSQVEGRSAKEAAHEKAIPAGLPRRVVGLGIGRDPPGWSAGADLDDPDLSVPNEGDSISRR